MFNLFKSFTWAKLAADLGIVAGVVTSPLLLGLVPAATAAYIVSGGALLRAIASFITTNKAGNATTATGATVKST